MITAKELDDLEMRLAKGWVIRPDQISLLIAFVRQYLAVRAGEIEAGRRVCIRCDAGKPCTIAGCPNVSTIAHGVPKGWMP